MNRAGITQVNLMALLMGALMFNLKYILNKRMMQKETECFIERSVCWLKEEARKKVLIDSSICTAELVHQLQQKNIECIKISASEIGCLSIAEGADVVILDIDSDKLRLMKVIRKMNPDAAILGCGDENWENLAKALDAGMNGTIAWPVSSEDVINIAYRGSI